MMQVEDKPDVTYSDVGGCKEQIEKLREVVETPLLHVFILFLLSYILFYSPYSITFFYYSQKNLSNWELSPLKVFCFSDRLELEKHFVLEL